jgi:hypothetical protein
MSSCSACLFNSNISPPPLCSIPPHLQRSTNTVQRNALFDMSTSNDDDGDKNVIEDPVFWGTTSLIGCLIIILWFFYELTLYIRRKRCCSSAERITGSLPDNNQSDPLTASLLNDDHLRQEPRMFAAVSAAAYERPSQAARETITDLDDIERDPRRESILADEEDLSKDYSADSGILPSSQLNSSSTYTPGMSPHRTRAETSTIHINLWGGEHHIAPPFRQVLIVIQILIQGASTLQVKYNDGVIGIGKGEFTNLDGLLLHVIKVMTWVLALVADRMRGTRGEGVKKRAYFALPIAVIFFAASATSTMEWPPDPSTCVPMFQLLDIVYLYLMFIVTGWSALGCSDLNDILNENEEYRDGGRRSSSSPHRSQRQRSKSSNRR